MFQLLHNYIKFVTCFTYFVSKVLHIFVVFIFSFLKSVTYYVGMGYALYLCVMSSFQYLCANLVYYY